MSMARKMTLEEQAAFEDAVAGTRSIVALEGTGLFGNLESKRDAAMVLSPELRIWFDLDWPFRIRS